MDHLTPGEVTALGNGSLSEERLDHVADCDHCANHLTSVSAALATAPAPVMPAEVAARLAEVVAAENRRRTSGETAREEQRQQAAHAKRLSLGSFGDNSPPTEFVAKRVDQSDRISQPS